MPSTFTPCLQLEKIATGEQNNTWGATTDTNLDKIEAGIGYKAVSSTVFNAAQATVTLALPAAYSRFRLTWQDLRAVSPAPLYARFSVDNGATFLSAAEYFTAGTTTVSTGQTVSAQASAPYLQLSPSTSYDSMFGHMEFQAFGLKSGTARVTGLMTPAGLFIADTAIFCSNQTLATHVLIGFVGASCAAGRINLYGAV